MLFNKDNFKSIKNGNLTHIPNFTPIEETIDFNLLAELYDEYRPVSKILPKRFYPDEILSSPFLLKNIHEHPFFNVYFNFFNKQFNSSDNIVSELDIFFSFASGAGGVHADREDVHIVGLKGKTIYRCWETNNINEYTISQGDYIFIPKGTKHSSITVTPRMIMSHSIFN